MKIRKNIPLHKETTFKIGGSASHFVSVSTVAELEKAVLFAKEQKLSFFVLGEGSNTLAPDSGFKGLVIKNEIRGIKIKEQDGHFILEAGAGENWDSLVAFSVSQKLYGLENLSYIPGSVGGAPIQNIGAYGTEVKEIITEVEVFDTESVKLKVLSNTQCKFAYRDSIFKHKKGKHLIVTKVSFKLSKSGVVNIGYKDLKNYFKDKYSNDIVPSQVRDAVVFIRKNKLPDWKKVATAGSFFKNPFITKAHFERLKKIYPNMPGFVEGDKVKISLAYVLDAVCNLSGFEEGNVGLYERQPLAIVNFGGATFLEIKKFADHMASLVKEKTDIEIEWEVRVME